MDLEDNSNVRNNSLINNKSNINYGNYEYNSGNINDDYYASKEKDYYKKELKQFNKHNKKDFNENNLNRMNEEGNGVIVNNQGFKEPRKWNKKQNGSFNSHKANQDLNSDYSMDDKINFQGNDLQNQNRNKNKIILNRQFSNPNIKLNKDQQSEETFTDLNEKQNIVENKREGNTYRIN